MPTHLVELAAILNVRVLGWDAVAEGAKALAGLQQPIGGVAQVAHGHDVAAAKVEFLGWPQDECAVVSFLCTVEVAASELPTVSTS